MTMLVDKVEASFRTSITAPLMNREGNQERLLILQIKALGLRKKMLWGKDLTQVEITQNPIFSQSP